MKQHLLVTLVCILGVCGFSWASEPKVLLLAGPDSHGWGEHEHRAGCAVLAKALNESTLGIRAEVHEGWPEDPGAFEGVVAVVVYCDGGGANVANGHAEELDKLRGIGMGTVFLHYALEVDMPLRRTMLDSLGGYFEANWSVNPVWTPKVTLGDHPVTNGVKPFELKGEWYFHMRFREGMEQVTPVASAMASLEDLTEEDTPRGGNAALRAEIEAGKPQHLAWVSENEGESRGFGFTGGHSHFDWTHDDYRKLVLNGIAWAAKREIPEGGVESKRPVIRKYKVMLRAVAMGDAEEVERHLLLGADANGRNKSGWTPLHYATVRNREAVGAVLLKHGADANAVSKTRNAPIHMCADRNFPDFARMLIEHGANLGLRNSSGWTPLHAAAAKDRLDVAKVLIEGGAKVNALSEAGGTPLHEAAASAGREMIQLLLDKGVDKTVVSSTGMTALDIAKEFENEAAVEMLR